jgi:hypothetical protein
MAIECMPSEARYQYLYYETLENNKTLQEQIKALEADKEEASMQYELLRASASRTQTNLGNVVAELKRQLDEYKADEKNMDHELFTASMKAMDFLIRRHATEIDEITPELTGWPAFRPVRVE